MHTVSAGSAAQQTALPRWYWVIASVILLWMLIGAASWVMDLLMSDAMLENMSEAQREVYARRPPWMFWLYAGAVFSGLAGGIGLLLRARWASGALLVSVVLAIVQFSITMWGPMDALALLGAAVALPLPVSVVLAGAASWWFSRMADNRGWLS